MIPFDPAHRAVHYPPDRRFRIWIRPSILIGIGFAILSVIAASWIEVALAGLRDVKPWRLMVERVRVIEFFREQPGQRGWIGQAKAADGFERRKLRQRHLQAEQLLREQRADPRGELRMSVHAGADGRPA